MSQEQERKNTEVTNVDNQPLHQAPSMLWFLLPFAGLLLYGWLAAR